MNSPFLGLRVVDLSDRFSGAFAARLFGDFGAEVILAEPPDGHALRREPPFLDGIAGEERSVVHAYVNWNKSSIVIKHENELEGLIASADVVITTSDGPPRPALQQLRDDAVHVCITAHGIEDSLTGRPGNTLTHSARVGWSYINGYRDEPPLSMPRHQGGVVVGVTGLLLRRRHCGVGTKDPASILMSANSKPSHLPFTLGVWPRCITTQAVRQGRAGVVAEVIPDHSGT